MSEFGFSFSVFGPWGSDGFDTAAEARADAAKAKAQYPDRASEIYPTWRAWKTFDDDSHWQSADVKLGDEDPTDDMVKVPWAGDRDALASQLDQYRADVETLAKSTEGETYGPSVAEAMAEARGMRTALELLDEITGKGEKS